MAVVDNNIQVFGGGVESPLSAFDVACHETDIYAVFWTDNAPLYHIFVQWYPALLLFSGVVWCHNAVIDGKRRYFYKGKCSEISVFVFQKRSDIHQFTALSGYFLCILLVG